MAESTSKSYSLDPALYLYTSLTAGSSHIVTATSRLETILKANKIPFKALDIATDEKARMLWGRRAGKDESGRMRKIPGLVQMGLVLGDLVEVEDWNEYGELKQHVKIVHDTTPPVKSDVPAPSTSLSRASLSSQNASPQAPVQEKPKTAPVEASKPVTKEPEIAKDEDTKSPKDGPLGGVPTAFTLALRQAGEEAAQKAQQAKNKVVEVFSGTGEAAETSSKDEDNPATGSLESLRERKSITSSSSIELHDDRPIEHRIFQNDACMQSISGSWKPIDVDEPVTTHRGSVLSEASAEEIRKIEEEETICEEDEEDVED